MLCWTTSDWGHTHRTVLTVRYPATAVPEINKTQACSLRRRPHLVEAEEVLDGGGGVEEHPVSHHGQHETVQSLKNKHRQETR